MAASDYVPIFFKNRLHLAGRPQMGTTLAPAARATSATRSCESRFLPVWLCGGGFRAQGRAGAVWLALLIVRLLGQGVLPGKGTVSNGDVST